MDTDFLRSLVKDLGDENTTIAADGKSSAEFSGTIDTGSYMLNAVVSGSLYGGVPNNKITAFAGESATGKTYFVLGVISQFLKACIKTPCKLTQKHFETKNPWPADCW